MLATKHRDIPAFVPGPNAMCNPTGKERSQDRFTWQSVSNRVSYRNLDAGTVLCEQGDQLAHMAEIRSGLLKLESGLEDGGYRIIRLLGPGDVIGLEALFDRTATHRAVALIPSLIEQVPLSDMHRKLDQDPQLAWVLCNHWRTNLERSEAVLTRYTVGTSKQRMARLLLDLSLGVSQQDSALIPLPPGEDLAALISATKETVSRSISSLVRIGAMEKQRDRMVLVRRDKMHDVLA